MKKVRIFLATAVIVSAIGGKAFAQGEISLKDVAGMTPDNIFYAVDKALDDLKVSFTFDDEEKIDVMSDIAQERLGEAQLMAEDNKEDLAQKAVEDYEEKMDVVHENLEEVANKSEESVNAQNVEENKENVSNEEDKGLQELEQEIIAKQMKSIEVLKSIQEKVGENAKKNIAKVIEMQTAKKEAVINMVEKRHDLNEAKKVYKKAVLDLQKAKKSGEPNAIKVAEEALNAQKLAYEASKEEFKKVFQEHKDAVKAVKEAKKELKEEVKKDDKIKKKNSENKANEQNGEKEKNNEKTSNSLDKIQKEKVKNNTVEAKTKNIEDKLNAKIQKLQEIKQEKSDKAQEKQNKISENSEKDKQK